MDNPTITEQLDAATAQAAKFSADLTAASALLDEANAARAADAAKIQGLEHDLSGEIARVKELGDKLTAHESTIAAHAATIADLNAKLADATAKLTLAPFADASTNGRKPVGETPGASGESLNERLAAIKDPKERANFRRENYAALMNERKPSRKD